MLKKHNVDHGSPKRLVRQLNLVSKLCHLDHLAAVPHFKQLLRDDLVESPPQVLVLVLNQVNDVFHLSQYYDHALLIMPDAVVLPHIHIVDLLDLLD